MRKGVTKRIVSSRKVKAFWNCEYCGTKHIDGLIDSCPNCGVHKPIRTRYNLDRTNIIEVKKEELAEAGIDINNCDGKHPDWVCEYCSSLNNYLDEFCYSCGSPKSESKEDYFSIVENNTNKPDTPINIVKNNSKVLDSLNKLKSSIGYKGIVSILGVISVVLLLIFLLAPYKETTEVSDLFWKREIVIEELKTFKESGWSTPVGARVYDEKVEIYTYKQVIDHYENVEVTKTREVFSHYEYDYEYEYIDNGDGTYTENKIEVKIPVYKTETYTEIEKQPVYRQDPVYKTKYYYEIDRWTDVRTVKSSGNDKEPYWSTNYTLGYKERDTERYEVYTVYYSNGNSVSINYNEWIQTNIGDKVEITKCRLGIVYNQSRIE